MWVTAWRADGVLRTGMATCCVPTNRQVASTEQSYGEDLLLM